MVREPEKLAIVEGWPELDGQVMPMTITDVSANTDSLAISVGGALESRKCMRVAAKP